MFVNKRNYNSYTYNFRTFGFEAFSFKQKLNIRFLKKDSKLETANLESNFIFLDDYLLTTCLRHTFFCIP